MLRTLMITLATLVIGLPASVAALVGLARLSGLKGGSALFAVAIGSCLLWTLLLFAVLWFTLRKAES
ncbi:hypothetical protein [Sphingomonas sp. dw_22]|uniref:hypothetical protein n=1 Tax=Sphingomonas sp. dw_22 TaxID=2721175 RepID=UPI001BD2865C|nr:hypothetical protein [Sphingomonas sp. dw_22]